MAAARDVLEELAKDAIQEANAVLVEEVDAVADEARSVLRLDTAGLRGIKNQITQSLELKNVEGLIVRVNTQLTLFDALDDNELADFQKLVTDLNVAIEAAREKINRARDGIHARRAVQKLQIDQLQERTNGFITSLANADLNLAVPGLTPEERFARAAEQMRQVTAVRDRIQEQLTILNKPNLADLAQAAAIATQAIATLEARIAALTAVQREATTELIATLNAAAVGAQQALATAQHAMEAVEDPEAVEAVVNAQQEELRRQVRPINEARDRLPEDIPVELTAAATAAHAAAAAALGQIAESRDLAVQQIVAARYIVGFHTYVTEIRKRVAAAYEEMEEAPNPHTLGDAAEVRLAIRGADGIPALADARLDDIALNPTLRLHPNLIVEPNRLAAIARGEVVAVRNALQKAQAAATAVAALDTDGDGNPRGFILYVERLVEASRNVDDAGISDTEKLVLIRTHLTLLEAEHGRIQAQRTFLEQSNAEALETTKTAIRELDARLTELRAAQAGASNNLVAALEQANADARAFGTNFEGDLDDARKDLNASNAVEAIDERRLALIGAIETARTAANAADLTDPGIVARLGTANAVAQEELMYLNAMDDAIDRCAIALTQKSIVAKVNARIADAKAARTTDGVRFALQDQEGILDEAENDIGADLNIVLSPQLVARGIHLANTHANDEANATKRDIAAARQEIDKIEAAFTKAENFNQAVVEVRKVVEEVRTADSAIDDRAKTAGNDVGTWGHILREVDAQEQRLEIELGRLPENLQYTPELSNELIDAANREADEVVAPLRQSQLFHAAIAAEAATAIARIEVDREDDINNLKNLIERKLVELRQRQIALTEAATRVGDIGKLEVLREIAETAKINIDKEIEDLKKALAVDAVCRAALDKKNGIADEVNERLADDESSQRKIEFIKEQQEILEEEQKKIRDALTTVNDVEGIALLKDDADNLISQLGDEITRLDTLKKEEQKKAVKALGQRLGNIHEKVVANSIEIRNLLADINEAKRAVVWAIDTDQPQSVIDANREEVERLKKALAAKEADATEIGREADQLRVEIEDAESWLESTYPVPIAYLRTVNSELEARIAFEKNCADIAYHKGRTERITRAIGEDGERIKELRDLNETTILSSKDKHELAELSRRVQSGFDRLAESEAELIRLEAEREAAYDAVYTILEEEWSTRETAGFDVTQVKNQTERLQYYHSEHRVDINDIQNENAELRNEYASLLIYGNAQSAVVEPPVKPPEADKPLRENDGGILGIPGYFQKREAESALEDGTAAVAAFKENEKRLRPIIWAILDARIAGNEEEEAKALDQWGLREGHTFDNVAHRQKLYGEAKAAIRDLNEKMVALGTAASPELRVQVKSLKHQWSMAARQMRAIDIINSLDLYARELHKNLKEIEEKIKELNALDPDSESDHSEIVKIKAELKALSAEAGLNAQMVKDLQSARERLREEIRLEGDKIVSDLTDFVVVADPCVVEASTYTAEAQAALNDALVQEDEIKARMNRWNGLRLAYGQDVLPTSAEDLSREGKTLAEHKAEAQANLFGLLHFTVENIIKDPELFKRYKQAMAVLHPSLKINQNAEHIQKHVGKALLNAPELKGLMELGGQKQLDYWREGHPLRFKQEKPEEYKAWKAALLKWQIETIANSRSHSAGTMVVVAIRNSSDRTVSFYAAEQDPTAGEYVSKGLLIAYVEAQMAFLRKTTGEEKKRILKHLTAGILSANSHPGFANSSAAKRVYEVILSGLDAASIPMTDREGYDLREATWDMLESDKRLAEEDFSFTAEVPFEAVRRMMIAEIIPTNSNSTQAEKNDAAAVIEAYHDIGDVLSIHPAAERLDARGFKSTDTIATTIPNEAGEEESANYKISEKDGTIHLELQKPDPSDPIAAPMTIAKVDIQDLGAERVKVSGSAQPSAGPEVAAMVAEKITAPRASGNKTCVFKLKKYARDWMDLISGETGVKREAEYVKAILAKGVVPVFEVHKKKDSESAIWATFRDLAVAANKQYTDATACAAYLNLVFATGNEKLKEKLITSMFLKTGELVSGQLWIYDGTQVATQAEFEALDEDEQKEMILQQAIKPQSLPDSDKKLIHEAAAKRKSSEAEEKVALKARGGKPADPLLAVSKSLEERVKETNKPRSYHVRGTRGH